MKGLSRGVVLALLLFAAAAGAEEGYPGLPELSLSRYLQPRTRAGILKAIDAAVAGRAAEHLAALDRELIRLTSTRTSFQRTQAYERAVTDAVPRWLLAQAAFLRSVTPDKFSRLAKQDSYAGFLTRLLQSPVWSESFLDALKAEDDVGKVLEVWADLWAGDPEGRETYANLALAFALVFDRPVSGVDVRERYRFFRDSAERHKLKTDLRKLPASELVWVVDAGLSEDELTWAQRNVKLGQRDWSRAYTMVRYRMDKAVHGKNPYDSYTLEEILEEGGTCGDRAYFAAMTAKANGIPAMIIAGEGARGGHAWFGYMPNSREWNIEAGRFTSDNYAAGSTVDPQTGKRLKEHELQLLTDSERRTSRYDKASRLTRLGELFEAAGETERAGLAYEMALATSRRRVEAWTDYIAYLKKTDAPAEKWEDVIRDIRAAFRDYPDMLTLANDLEAERAADVGAKEALRAVQQQMRRIEDKAGDRTDLIVANVLKQAEILEQEGDVAGVLRTYKKALGDYGRDVAPFKSLSAHYFSFAKQHGEEDAAVREIESVFKRCYPRPRRDYFAMTTYARLLRLIAGLYEQSDQAHKARRLVRDAEKMEEQAQRRYGSRR